MRVGSVSLAAGVGTVLLASVVLRAFEPQAPQPASAAPAAAERALLNQYCVTCHNSRVKAGELVLESLDPPHPAQKPQVWEQVVRKLRTRAMPPPGSRRPDDRGYEQLVGYLETEIDRRAASR